MNGALHRSAESVGFNLRISSFYILNSFFRDLVLYKQSPQNAAPEAKRPINPPPEPESLPSCEKAGALIIHDLDDIAPLPGVEPIREDEVMAEDWIKVFFKRTECLFFLVAV